MIQTLGWRSILRYPTRTVQATGHRRCDLEHMMKFEPIIECRQKQVVVQRMIQVLVNDDCLPPCYLHGV
jgi:hypothetical protein